MGINVTIPLRTVSEANAHEHWRKRAKRAKAQHALVALSLMQQKRPELPCTVVITRFGKRQMDSDNAIISCKHVRDAVAKWLGVDDGPSGPVTWLYGQVTGDYAVRIEAWRPRT